MYGEPVLVTRSQSALWVYPRMYGETLDNQYRYFVVRGLSPHVRGNLGRRCPARVWQRSIPACTGKPVCGDGIAVMPRVYPRMYGET